MFIKVTFPVNYGIHARGYWTIQNLGLNCKYSINIWLRRESSYNNVLFSKAKCFSKLFIIPWDFTINLFFKPKKCRLLQFELFGTFWIRFHIDFASFHRIVALMFIPLCTKIFFIFLRLWWFTRLRSSFSIKVVVSSYCKFQRSITPISWGIKYLWKSNIIIILGHLVFILIARVYEVTRFSPPRLTIINNLCIEILIFGMYNLSLFIISFEL